MKRIITILGLIALASCGPAQVRDVPRESGNDSRAYTPRPNPGSNPGPAPVPAPPQCTNCGIDQANPSVKTYDHPLP